MHKKDGIVIYMPRKRRSNKTFLAYLAIGLFVVLFVPFFGSTLRYQTGTTIKYIFNNFGYLCLVLGATGFVLTWLKVFGGKISPLLANIALDGMERLFGAENSKGNYTSPSRRRGENNKLNLIRYADDFVVIAPSREKIINYVLPTLRTFLKERGMELNEAKTKIRHRDDGFDFLGFNIRQYHSKARRVCLAKPSKKAVKRHLEHIKTLISKNKQIKADELISKLNPIIRGWANYYCYSSAKETFNYIDYRIWKMLWQWCLRRHNNKGKRWIRYRYFMNLDNRRWIFGERKENVLLFCRSFRAGVKYTPVKGYNSPYDASLHEYWSKRYSKSWRETTPM